MTSTEVRHLQVGLPRLLAKSSKSSHPPAAAQLLQRVRRNPQSQRLDAKATRTEHRKRKGGSRYTESNTGVDRKRSSRNHSAKSNQHTGYPDGETPTAPALHPEPCNATRYYSYYRYQPLDHWKKSIRLIKFREQRRDSSFDSSSSAYLDCNLPSCTPSSKSSFVMACTIEHFDLSTAPSYKAISYEWGESGRYADSRHGVHVNGSWLRLSSNLLRFLGYIKQHKLEDVWLWIDQISIDQDNLQERTHQVEQMSEIFRGASEVLVWLGGGSDGGSSITNADPTQSPHLKEYDAPLDTTPWPQSESHMDSDWLHSEEGDVPVNNFSNFDFQYSLPIPGQVKQPVHGVDRDHCPADGADSDAYLSYVPMRSYWLRLWIIQEVILGRSITVFFGGMRLEWDTIVESARRLDSPSATTKRLLHLHELRQTINNRSWTWKDVIHLFTSARCMDIRDRAYGMLGLVHESVQIAADYTAEATDVVEAIIHKEFKAWFGHDFGLVSGRVLMNKEFKDLVWKLFLAFDVWTARKQSPKLKYIRDML